MLFICAILSYLAVAENQLTSRASLTSLGLPATPPHPLGAIHTVIDVFLECVL